MELYKLIATCNNNTTVHTFEFLPENFEGVKISQTFSFQNPIGYTPKFSVETMRAILSDKIWLDNIFNIYGLQGDVKIEIQKLNVSGTSYQNLSYFAVDFESYTIFDEYSDFAIKSISTFDFYNNLKNVEADETLNEGVYLPSVFYFKNSVSLIDVTNVNVASEKAKIVTFTKNNDAKFYNSDYSLLKTLIIGGINVDNADIYNFGKDYVSISLLLNYIFDCYVSLSSDFYGSFGVSIFKNNINTPIYSFFSTYITTGSQRQFPVSLNVKNANLNLTNIEKGDVLFIAFDYNSDGVVNLLNVDINFDFSVLTDSKIFSNFYLRYITSETLIKKYFNNKVSYFNDDLKKNAVTNFNSIKFNSNKINITPKNLIEDFCLVQGAIINSKINGNITVDKISNYFNNLLNVANAILIDNFKDVSIKYDNELNFSGVEVGKDAEEYDMYTYLIDWNKILTFKQLDRNATEILSLIIQKFRVDFSGILEAIFKKTEQKTDSKNDLFFFDKNVIERTSTTDNLYDYYTPRDILENWRTFLSFCFQNYGKNTLKILSNGGTEDNLQINGVNQMDDFVLTNSVKILPLKVEFTCLINDVDFSEHILKINHNDENLYIFVTNAETTDKLNEQKITGNLIYFPE